MNWLRTNDHLSDAGWAHGWSTNAGPDFAGDPADASQFASVNQLVAATRLSRAAWVNQVHGSGVLYADKSGLLGDGDAVWSDQTGLGVVGRSADCPLILVGGFRSNGSALWGFAHASWRSTVAGITRGLLQDMTTAGLVATTCRCVICPSAGPCCYEVGPEVRRIALEKLGQSAEAFFQTRQTGLHFDLWAANRAQLSAAGIPSAAVITDGLCTICGNGPYPSYRRDGATAGRMAAIIGCPTTI